MVDAGQPRLRASTSTAVKPHRAQRRPPGGARRRRSTGNEPPPDAGQRRAKAGRFRRPPADRCRARRRPPLEAAGGACSLLQRLSCLSPPCSARLILVFCLACVWGDGIVKNISGFRPSGRRRGGIKPEFSGILPSLTAQNPNSPSPTFPQLAHLAQLAPAARTFVSFSCIASPDRCARLASGIKPEFSEFSGILPSLPRSTRPLAAAPPNPPDTRPGLHFIKPCMPFVHPFNHFLLRRPQFGFYSNASRGTGAPARDAAASSGRRSKRPRAGGRPPPGASGGSDRSHRSDRSDRSD